MIIRFLFVMMHAWCAQNSVTMEEDVTRYADDLDQDKGKVMPLTACGVQNQGSGRRSFVTACGVQYASIGQSSPDKIVFEKRANFCHLLVCKEGVFSQNRFLTIESGCYLCSSMSSLHMHVLRKDCKGTIASYQVGKLPSEILGHCSLKNLKMQSDMPCKYDFQEDKFTLSQVLCEYKDGSEFTIVANIHYADLARCEISAVLKGRKGQVLAKHKTFSFFGCDVQQHKTW